ncbi:hypothetical protein U1Q18_015199 [Sarracenia purpurea var. burkii]
MSGSTSSVDKVTADDDLLTEIFIRLPVKSVLQFKSVSKHWFFLITAPHFARRRNSDPGSVSGLFFYSSMRRPNPELKFIPLRNERKPEVDSFSRTLTELPLSGMAIISSCRGLLCCSRYPETEFPNRSHQCIILNPTIKQFNLLPEPPAGLQGLNLAFDPSRSPHYKVVCVWCTVSIRSTKPYQSEEQYRIEIYSSETGSWRGSAESFAADYGTQFLGGVYCNGAIHWFNTRSDSLYFEVEDERLGIIPMPPVPSGEWDGRPFRYYGESRDHLHLVEFYVPTTRFDVYEMERDYSGWSVKYRVDLGEVGAAFPDMMQRFPWEPMYYSFAILSVVRGEEEEGSFLVLHVPGKVVRYSLVDKSFEELCDVAPEHCDSNGMIEDSLRYFWFHAFQFIETLSSI